MSAITPSSAEELASVLAESASRKCPITLVGNNSKRLMAGPIVDGGVTVCTSGLRRLLQYEPSDLTVSVEAGMPFAQLQAMLGERKQMIALDPPFAAEATVGGVVASNSSGSLRRGFGTSRDLIIGMSFATLEGKLIRTGGMVVKNVAGLDMAKLMIGSFGTLAAIASINFRVHSLPDDFRTFLFSAPDADVIFNKRDEILKGQLQPMAIDLLSPPAAARFDRDGYVLGVRASGSRAALARYERDLKGSEVLSGDNEKQFWKKIREFTPNFLSRQPGLVLRVSTPLKEMPDLLRMISGPSISRAGSGVTYLYVSSIGATAPFWKTASERGWTAVIEFASDEIRRNKELWQQPVTPSRENAFAMMKSVKQMFDPANLLNSSRLYGRI